MNKYISKQEELCLEVRDLCDLLRTKLYQIETFSGSDYEKWNKKLKSLKVQVCDIYWNL